MFLCKARVEYHSIWCIGWVDPDIGHYYRSLIPKARYAQRPQFDSHITIVSKYDEPERLPPIWGKYEGQEFEIRCDGLVRACGQYFGMNCWSDEIGDLREGLGLPRMMGDQDCYHITVGNTKNV